MTRTQLFRTSVLALGAALAACGGNSQPRTAPTPDALFERGTTLFEQGKNRKAAQVLQEFVEQYVADPRVPQALLLRGRAHARAGEHLMATADFLRVATEFPRDSLAQPARYALCEAYVELSPRPALDQEYTRAALGYCDSYAALYPGTEEAREAERLVTGMRTRLARKLYDNGYFYFRRRAYDAALIYFAQAVREYPATPVAPMALLRMYESYGRLGYEEEQAEVRERLLREYPQSPEARSLAG